MMATICFAPSHTKTTEQTRSGGAAELGNLSLVRALWHATQFEFTDGDGGSPPKCRNASTG